MGRITLAIKLFFKVLTDTAFWERHRAALEPLVIDRPSTSAVAKPAPATTTTPARPTTTKAPAPAPLRSDAITLLAVLQRESRLIDFLKEEITAYQDAQIGAAVRDVHRDAAAALERLLALRPVLDTPEGADVPLPNNPDPNRFRLVGNLTATPPAKGRLQHTGWQATKLDLPQYTGTTDAAKIVAPAEVEV